MKLKNKKRRNLLSVVNLHQVRMKGNSCSDEVGGWGCQQLEPRGENGNIEALME